MPSRKSLPRRATTVTSSWCRTYRPRRRVVIRPAFFSTPGAGISPARSCRAPAPARWWCTRCGRGCGTCASAPGGTARSSAGRAARPSAGRPARGAGRVVSTGCQPCRCSTIRWGQPRLVGTSSSPPSPVAVRPSPSLSTVIRPAASSSVTAEDTDASASLSPLCRSRSVLRRASAASWCRSRDHASAKNASSQSWRNCRSHALVRGGSASSRSVNSSCRGPAPRPAPASGGAALVGERAAPRHVVGERAGELQGAVHELLVRQLVQQVQLLGERAAGQRRAARHPGAGQEQVGERRPPQEVRLAHAVREMRVQPCGHRRHPGLETGVVGRLGQRVQRHAQLGQRRDHHGDPLRPQPGDVDVHAHAPMVHPATDSGSPIDGRRQPGPR